LSAVLDTMSDLDLLTILQRLASAYPEKNLTVDTLALYQQQLSDIPLPLLDQAVFRHIQSSPWFPHISDLRKEAAQLSGQSDFSNLSRSGEDILGHEAIHLEERYTQTHVLDLHDWEKLARALENVGRLNRAEELRRKFNHLQALEAACQMGED
jgi:hypothetical protein